MGRRVSRVIRRVSRETLRGVDLLTGDILDLDGSKQKEQIEAIRKEEEKAEERAEEKKKVENKYQQNVANSKDKFMKEDGLTEDNTGVGLSDVKIDFTKKINKPDDEDNLKKMLKRY